MDRNNYNADPYVKEFGLHVNPKMANFDGRILNPPKVSRQPAARTSADKSRKFFRLCPLFQRI